MKRFIQPAMTLILVVVIALFWQAAYVVGEHEQVIVLQLGQHKRTVQNPGLKFKIPFIQDAIYFESRVLMADSAAAEYITLDKKRLLVDHISRWRISDPLVYYQAVRSEPAALIRLEQIIGSALRQEIARHDFIDIIREERERIMQTVTEESKQLALQYGIEVLDVRIRRVDLPSEVQESVFTRMEAERQRIAMRYRAEGEEAAREIRSNANKEREIILATAFEQAERLRGEGDAMAARIYAEAYGQDPDFYNFRRRMEAYEEIIQNDTMLLLDIRSDLLRYLDGPNGN